MKNTLGDLNNYLFLQLERLDDDELTFEDLEAEIMRSKAITDVAARIIQNGDLVLRAKKMMDDRMDADLTLPKMLEG